MLYVSNKRKACAEVGIDSETLHFPTGTTKEELISRIRILGADARTHGILVQLPLPAHLKTEDIIEEIPPSKDVDGLHSSNVANLTLGRPGFVPCTPAGVMEILHRSAVHLEGMHAVVVGRSNLVGRPLLQLLLRENCTVSVCHSKTRDLGAITKQADLLVAAMGRPAALGFRQIKKGSIVIDVGINRLSKEEAPAHFFTRGSRTARILEKRGKVLVGDVDPFAAKELASAYTPVPGGVGPMTIAMLLNNTYLAAKMAAELS